MTAMPEKLGRYVLEKELGQGAMGRVYLGHDPAIDRKVALKVIVLPSGLGEVERREAEARFSREIKAAGRLSHPHIVTVFDVGEDSRAGTFVAMEYVQGRTLEMMMGAGHLPEPRTVASIGCQAADALAYAHRNGIVHRDIKPANLILVDGQTIKIADFGLAKPAGANLTSDGAILGTPYYMSPEQIQGGALDGRSDLFSLAVVIYQLLTGKRPFRGDSVSTVVYRVLHEPPVEPDLSHLPDSGAVKAFLAQALAKDAERRFADGDAFARGLREAMSLSLAAETPVPAKTPPLQASPERAGKPPASEIAERAPVPRAGEGTAAAGLRSPARGEGPGKKETGGSRKVSPPAPRRQHRISLMPFVLGFTLLTALAFIYRESLVEQVLPLFGVPVAEDTAASPLAPDPALQSQKTVMDAGQSVSVTEPPAPSRMLDQPVEEEPPTPVATKSPEEEPRVQAMAADSSRSVRLLSDPEGAAMMVDGGVLNAAEIPVPEDDGSVLVKAVLGCQVGDRRVTAADAGQEVTISLGEEIIPVRVEAKPGRADVLLDGEKVGRTPLTVEMNACQPHQLTLKRAEFRDWSQAWELVDGRLDVPATLLATLEPLPRGMLQAPSPPYPMVMTLAGGRRLQPGEKVSLVANRYRVTLENKDLMFRKQIRVSVAAEQTTLAEADFPPLAQFQLLASPSNVDFTLKSESGERNLGSPPFIGGIEVVSGAYTLICRFQHNQEEQRRKIVLEPGKNSTLKFISDKPK